MDVHGTKLARTLRTMTMSRAFKITGLTLMLAFPSLALGQTGTTKGVASILRPALLKIKKQAHAPILLPNRLPSTINVNEIHVVDGEGKPDGWEISLFYKAGCGDACFVGYFEAKRGENVSKNDADNTVHLVKGITGYYTARSCGGSCTPPQIEWMHAGVLYTIQFNVNGKTKHQDKLEIIALANSAILGGVR